MNGCQILLGMSDYEIKTEKTRHIQFVLTGYVKSKQNPQNTLPQFLTPIDEIYTIHHLGQCHQGRFLDRFDLDQTPQLGTAKETKGSIDFTDLEM